MNDMPNLLKPFAGRNGLAASLRALVAVIFLIVGLFAGLPHASAQSLDAARASGMVGERYDGYAVARDSATPAVRQLVQSVNSQRAQIYQKRAGEQGIPASEVGKLYARQIVAQAPSGTWILSESGSWQRK